MNEADRVGAYSVNWKINIRDQHFAIDILNVKGAPVLAPADGVVVWMKEKDPYGFLILTIDHPNGMSTHYGEIDKSKYHVNVGDVVKRGEIIGYQDSRYDELHFQVQTQPSEGKPTVQVDPFKLITDHDSESYWIFGNTPLALSKNGKWLRLNFNNK